MEMEDSWEKWISSLEIGGDNSIGQSHMNPSYEEKFQQPSFSFESASNSIISQDGRGRFFLSFENSTVETDPLPRPSPKQCGATTNTCSSLLCKGTLTPVNTHFTEPVAKQQRTNKFRSSSGIPDHIMAERKRRQQLAERFIALSATIPGLKKTDKASILGEAINYVKQLQERVKELENQKNSVILIKKSSTRDETSSCETISDSDECGLLKKALPQVEARILEKEVLIGIQCEKQKDIVLTIMALLQNLHLSLASSSVLPFGTSALKVTIIAKMDDKYCMTVNDIVENLRQDLFKFQT